jgi:hypothetical protein
MPPVPPSLRNGSRMLSSPAYSCSPVSSNGRDRLQVLDDPAWRRLVVVRRHDQEAVDAELVRLLGQMHRVAGVVGAGAGDHRGPVADRLDGSGVKVEALLVGEGRRLAGRARHDQAVRAVLDEERRELAELVEVDRAVGVERRHAGGQDFAQHVSILLGLRRTPPSARGGGPARLEGK